MALTLEQLKLRDGKLTASAVAPLMTGEVSKIMNMYYGMIGSPKYVPPDLDWVWPVQLGSVTEDLNLRFYERNTGHMVTRKGEVVTHEVFEWAACTLDGFDALDNRPVECKHVNGRTPRADVIARYQPQFHWIMIVCGVDQLALSLIEGANEPIIEIIEFDDDYGAQLLTRAQSFMLCVQTLRPPAEVLPVALPVKAERIVDMNTSNAWCHDAENWLATRIAARDHAEASKNLKSLVPEDAIRCHGAGIEISRSRAGALTIKERRN